jgi:hypothetical protein
MLDRLEEHLSVLDRRLGIFRIWNNLRRFHIIQPSVPFFFIMVLSLSLTKTEINRL